MQWQFSVLKLNSYAYIKWVQGIVFCNLELEILRGWCLIVRISAGNLHSTIFF